jgi:hypothetical protein
LEISYIPVASSLKTSTPYLPNKNFCLMPVMWAINTTFHTTLKASPAQLAFNRNMILPTSFTINWYAINNRKQTQSQSAADAKNCKHIPHEFCINDEVLIHRDIGNPYLGKQSQALFISL